MLELNAFKFCPKCKTRLTKKIKGSFLICHNCQTYFHINPHPTSAAIIVTPKQEILLVRRKNPPKQGWWDLPGGFAQPQETIEECLKRELYEELGIRINQYQYLGSYYSQYPYKKITYFTLCFAFIVPFSGPVKLAQDDVSQIRFVAKNRLKPSTLAFPDVRGAMRDFLRHN